MGGEGFMSMMQIWQCFHYVHVMYMSTVLFVHHQTRQMTGNVSMQSTNNVDEGVFSRHCAGLHSSHHGGYN
jgi:hypothetical protein